MTALVPLILTHRPRRGWSGSPTGPLVVVDILRKGLPLRGVAAEGDLHDPEAVQPITPECGFGLEPDDSPDDPLRTLEVYDAADFLLPHHIGGVVGLALVPVKTAQTSKTEMTRVVWTVQLSMA